MVISSDSNIIQYFIFHFFASFEILPIGEILPVKEKDTKKHGLILKRFMICRSRYDYHFVKNGDIEEWH